MAGVLAGIDWLFNVTNDALDIALPWVFLAILLVYPIYYLIRGLTKVEKEVNEEEKKNKLYDLFSGTFILFITSIGIFGVFWGIPKFIFVWLEKAWLVETIRWILFTLAVFITAYILGHKNGENRWKFSAAGHILLALFGWIIHRWVGILIISLPLLGVYYCSLYNLALIVLPTSNPESQAERWKRFVILVAYTWGIQRPLFVTGENAWKKTETRIAGDISHDLSLPGLVWTHSHEVVGITSGMKFKCVGGPGVVFTKKLERPLQVMDLRTQLRTSEIDVVSKDGIGFKTRIFASLPP